MKPHPETYDENLLFNRIAEGDEMAFRTIYDAYFDRLSAYVFKISKSESVTEEAVQDIFMKLWVNRSALAKVDNPQGYIFSIARNKAIDYLRKLTRETNLVTLFTESMQEHHNETDDKFSLQELQLLISKAVSQLSPQKQRIFHLSKYEDFSHDEIAQELNLSKSTIKNHLSETLHYLKRHLAGAPNAETLIVLLFIHFKKF